MSRYRTCMAAVWVSRRSLSLPLSSRRSERPANGPLVQFEETRDHTYRCLSSLGELLLEPHLQRVVVQQDERREEDHVPILGAVTFHERLQLAQHVAAERREYAMDEDRRHLVGQVRRQRSPLVVGVFGVSGLDDIVIPASPARFQEPTDYPEPYRLS